MYTYSTLPIPVRLLPLLVLMFVFLIGGQVTQLMLDLELPPAAIPAAPAAAPAAPPEQPAPQVAATLSPVFTPEVQYWAADIARWSKDFGVDANLAATVMQIESCGNPEAVSGSGAQGLFQVMPFHFTEGENMRDPETNARRGLAYLAGGLALAEGQPGLALAGYNGGHSQISKTWSLWPAETRRYYYWGSGIYGDVKAGLLSSERLAEWLSAGGASLCAKARVQLGL